MKNKLSKMMSLFGVLGVIGLTSCGEKGNIGGNTDDPKAGISFKEEKLSTVSYRLLTNEDLLNIDSSVTNKEVTYTIEDTSIARIEDGGILGLKTGKTKITVTPKDTSLKSDTLELNVVDTVFLERGKSIAGENYTFEIGGFVFEGEDVHLVNQGTYALEKHGGTPKSSATLTQVTWKTDDKMPEKYKGFAKNEDVFFVPTFKTFGYKTNKEFYEDFLQEPSQYDCEYTVTQTGAKSFEIEGSYDEKTTFSDNLWLINPKGYYEYYKKGLKVPSETKIISFDFAFWQEPLAN